MKLKKYVYKSVTSTNDIAIKKIKQGLSKGLIIAKKQTKGRGRYGSRWIYMKDNLFLTIFFNIGTSINLKSISLISCKIVQKSLIKLINKKIKIKKPNDLLINNKKVCGILQEIIFYKNRKFIIIGVGVNVYRSPIIVNYPTTYINFFTKRKLTSFKIYNEIKKNFENYLKNI
mgnify:FL=1